MNKQKEIYDKWTKCINDDNYKEYFISNEDEWYNNLEKVKKYINENNKRPSEKDKNKEIKQMGNWILHQQINYKKKEQIMRNQEIYDKWTEFINNNKYKTHFMSNEEEWYNNLEQVKKYIDDNNKKPSDKDKNKEKCQQKINSDKFAFFVTLNDFISKD